MGMGEVSEWIITFGYSSEVVKLVHQVVDRLLGFSYLCSFDFLGLDCLFHYLDAPFVLLMDNLAFCLLPLLFCVLESLEDTHSPSLGYFLLSLVA